MPIWKVLFVLVWGLVCLILAFATLIVPMTEGAGDYRWVWLGGLLLATGVMSTLFALFLRMSDRNFV